MIPTICHSGKDRLWRQLKGQWLLGRRGWRDDQMEHRVFLGFLVGETALYDTVMMDT